MIGLDRADRGEHGPRHPGAAGGEPVQAEVVGRHRAPGSTAGARLGAGIRAGTAPGDDGQHGAERGQCDHRRSRERPDRERRRRFAGMSAHNRRGEMSPMAVRGLLPAASRYVASRRRRGRATAAHALRFDCEATAELGHRGAGRMPADTYVAGGCLPPGGPRPAQLRASLHPLWAFGRSAAARRPACGAGQVTHRTQHGFRGGHSASIWGYGETAAVRAEQHLLTSLPECRCQAIGASPVCRRETVSVVQECRGTATPDVVE